MVRCIFIVVLRYGEEVVLPVAAEGFARELLDFFQGDGIDVLLEVFEQFVLLRVALQLGKRSEPEVGGAQGLFGACFEGFKYAVELLLGDVAPAKVAQNQVNGGVDFDPVAFDAGAGNGDESGVFVCIVEFEDDLRAVALSQCGSDAVKDFVACDGFQHSQSAPPLAIRAVACVDDAADECFVQLGVIADELALSPWVEGDGALGVCRLCECFTALGHGPKGALENGKDGVRGEVTDDGYFHGAVLQIGVDRFFDVGGGYGLEFFFLRHGEARVSAEECLGCADGGSSARCGLQARVDGVEVAPQHHFAFGPVPRVQDAGGQKFTLEFEVGVVGFSAEGEPILAQ